VSVDIAHTQLLHEGRGCWGKIGGREDWGMKDLYRRYLPSVGEGLTKRMIKRSQAIDERCCHEEKKLMDVDCRWKSGSVRRES
jgi:hypothetical protein